MCLYSVGYKHPLATHYSDQISRKKEFRFLLSFFLKRQYCDLSVYTNPYLASKINFKKIFKRNTLEKKLHFRKEKAKKKIAISTSVASLNFI